MAVSVVGLGFAIGAIPTIGHHAPPPLSSLSFPPLLASFVLISSLSSAVAMLMTSYLMYAFEFGKIIEACIQYFAGGLILAIGTPPHLIFVLNHNHLPLFSLPPLSLYGTIATHD
jgi:hypothetical protein